MAEDQEVSFHEIEWEALKRRFAKTPDGYLFHLDDVEALMGQIIREDKLPNKGFTPSGRKIGGSLQKAVEHGINPLVAGRLRDPIPLRFVGWEKIRDFKSDKVGFKFVGEIRVPAFRKDGNRTMYEKTSEFFPE